VEYHELSWLEAQSRFIPAPPSSGPEPHMTDKICVLLVDDHRILREGIRSILEGHEDIQVVGEAGDGRQAVSLVGELNPDVVLMDIAMPLLNGLEATRQIKRDHPEVKVLILSVHDEEEYIRQALSAGAMGYLLKYTSTSELLSAIRTVYQGEAVLSPAITTLVIEDYLRWADIKQASSDKLTPREREVLQLIAEGYTNKEIAEILQISVKTVMAHRSNLMGKLDLHSRGDLIKYAIQKKIIDI
jgi:two-component system response regulator NreC